MGELINNVASLGPFVISLLAMSLGAIVAILVYFVQRQHEQLRTRYLIEGLDALAEQLEKAHQSFRHNWAKGLDIVNRFKSIGAEMDLSNLEQELQEFDASIFNSIPTHRVQNLIRDPDNLIWITQQKTIARVQISVRKIRFEIMTQLNYYIAAYRQAKIPIDAEGKQYAEETLDLLRNMHLEFKRYYLFSDIIKELADELESVFWLRRKSITGFNSRPRVLELLEALHSIFGDLISENGQDQANGD